MPSVQVIKLSTSYKIMSLMLSATVPRRTDLYLRRLGLGRRQGVAEQQCHQEENQVVRTPALKKIPGLNFGDVDQIKEMYLKRSLLLF